MNPINYDLLISVVCLIAGFYVGIWKLRALNPRIYTAFLPAMVVASGMLYWGELAMVSFAGIYKHPEWLYQAQWVGTWGYTTGRMLNALCWALTLFCIVSYAPRCRNDKKFDL